MSKNNVGMTGKKHTLETRAKISKAHTGVKRSDETSAKMSEAHKSKPYLK